MLLLLACTIPGSPSAPSAPEFSSGVDSAADTTTDTAETADTAVPPDTSDTVDTTTDTSDTGDTGCSDTDPSTDSAECSDWTPAADTGAPYVPDGPFDAEATVILHGAAGSYLGEDLDLYPDADGDGIDEIAATVVGGVRVIPGPFSGVIDAEVVGWPWALPAGEAAGSGGVAVLAGPCDGTPQIAYGLQDHDAVASAIVAPECAGELSTLSTHGSPAEPLEYYQTVLHSAGDITGDGHEDAIAGGYYCGGNYPHNFCDESFVILPGPLHRGTLETQGYRVGPGDGAGFGLGDTDGDGIDDLVAGYALEHTSWRPLYGLLFRGPIEEDVSAERADMNFCGDDSDGVGAEPVGDADGDGLADIGLLSYHTWDVYLVSGTGSGCWDESDAFATLSGGRTHLQGAAPLDSRRADGMPGVALVGTSGDLEIYLGPLAGTVNPTETISPTTGFWCNRHIWQCSLDGTHDLTGDGVPDLLLGAGGADSGGVVYIFDGLRW